MKLAALTSWLVGVVTSGSPLMSELLLIVGVVVFAIATWRSRSPELLRRENKDLVSRNKTLEERVIEQSEMIAEQKARIASLEAVRDLPRVIELLTSALEREQQRADERTKLAVEEVASRLSLVDEAAADRYRDLDGKVTEVLEAVRASA